MSARVTRKRARTELEDACNEGAHDVGVHVDPAPDDAPANNSAGGREGAEEAANGRLLRRDEEFWFDDGTAILVAGDVEFRVYKGLLADHSPVFKDIFAEQHLLRTVHVDGAQSTACPVVHVSDIPQDLRHVLRVYMPREDASLFGTTPPSFDEISALIRLGQKYKIPQLYEQSLGVLKRHFTDDFDTWDGHSNWVPAGFCCLKAVGVVNLARLTGESTILPTALLACLMTDDDIVHGFEREDGSQENLTLDDLNLCFKAKTRISTASTGKIFRIFKRATSSGCKTGDACRTALRNALSGVEAEVDNLVGGNPFQDYDAYLKDGNIGVCESCLKMVVERDDKERRDLWNRLPELLGIEVLGWGQAKAAAAAAT